MDRYSEENRFAWRFTVTLALSHCGRRNSRGRCRAPQLAAGGVDFVSLALADLHIQSSVFQNLHEAADSIFRRRLVRQTGHRVVRNHVD